MLHLEVAHEEEIDRIKMDHRATKKLLDEQWSKLEEQQTEEKREKQRLEAEKEEAKR